MGKSKESLKSKKHIKPTFFSHRKRLIDFLGLSRGFFLGCFLGNKQRSIKLKWWDNRLRVRYWSQGFTGLFKLTLVKKSGRQWEIVEKKRKHHKERKTGYWGKLAKYS